MRKEKTVTRCHVFNITDGTFVTHMPVTEKKAQRIVTMPPKKITRGRVITLAVTDEQGKMLVNG